MAGNAAKQLPQRPLDPIATLVHEINNPLTLIMVNLELLEASLPQESFAEVQTYLQRAKNGVDHAHKVVQCAKRQHTASSQAENINVNAAIEALFYSLQTRFNQRSIHYVLDLEPDCTIRGELHRFLTIINNLLINAIESFVADTHKTRVIKLESSRKDDLLKIRISDNGCGMSNAVQKLIFDYGFTTKGSCRGKGLAIVVHNLYTYFAGQIDFLSSEGEGTIFELTFHLQT